MNKRFFLLTVAALALMACNKLETKVPITFSYGTVAPAETKAATNLNEENFASGGQIMVRVSESGTGQWQDYRFTIGADGSMVAPEPAPYYPDGGAPVDIAAYYPASAGSTFSVATDQTLDENYLSSELRFASVTNLPEQEDPVHLDFEPKMAKICVNVSGQGVGKITGLSLLNVKPTVSFNQTTGDVGVAGGTPTRIAVDNNGAAVIPPQTINGGLLEIETEKGTATMTVANKTFFGGYVYTLEVYINLKSVGTTTAITGWDDAGTVTVKPVVQTTNAPKGAEAVDLGLPSGRKWANMNIGATKASEYGTFFSWGENGGYTDKGDYSKNYFAWATYAWSNGSDERLTKYCPSDKQGRYWFDKSGSITAADDKSVLDRADDAARVNWGAGWHMPTKRDWEELLRYCRWNYQENYQGTNVDGELVTGPNGNSIFLPYAGERRETYFFDQRHAGYYWSSSVCEENPSQAWRMYIYFHWGPYMDNFKLTAYHHYFELNAGGRQNGHTVRAIAD